MTPDRVALDRVALDRVLYLDSNALAPLFIEEFNSAQVARLVREFSKIVVSSIAYAEVCRTFARAHFEGALDDAGFEAAVSEFDRIWKEQINVIGLSYGVSVLARDLLRAHQPHLRAMDAIHLACALRVRQDAPLRFLTFDKRLKAVSDVLFPTS